MQSNPNERHHMQKSRNIAARAGRWSARHRKTAVLGWIVFVVLAFMAGQNMGTETLTNEESGVGDSGRAAQITKDAYPDRIGEMVLVQSKSLETHDPEYRAVVADVTERLEATKGVSEIHGPYGKGEQRSAISDDGHSSLVSFEIKGDNKDAAAMKVVDNTVLEVEAAQKAHPDFNV